MLRKSSGDGIIHNSSELCKNARFWAVFLFRDTFLIPIFLEFRYVKDFKDNMQLMQTAYILIPRECIISVYDIYFELNKSDRKCIYRPDRAHCTAF